MARDRVRINAHRIDPSSGELFRNCPGPLCSGKEHNIDEFGLRKFRRYFEDGSDLVTNQSWCRECRSLRRQEEQRN